MQRTTECLTNMKRAPKVEELFKLAGEKADLVDKLNAAEVTVLLQRLFKTSATEDNLLIIICNRLGI